MDVELKALDVSKVNGEGFNLYDIVDHLRDVFMKHPIGKPLANEYKYKGIDGSILLYIHEDKGLNLSITLNNIGQVFTLSEGSSFELLTPTSKQFRKFKRLLED